ncbi:hypothetical protein ABZ016_05540 [Streptomyces sp. NPDC006372]|uniref:hypothetical protein n=1 Tax=Streptomyces sp. NPDC006372 TaxID=3155599 RepID=UPI0033A126F4
MRTGKGDISGWLGRLVIRGLPVACGAARALVVVGLAVCLWSWPSVGVAVAAGALRAYRRPPRRRPLGGRSVLRLCAGVVLDVLLSSVFPYVRPVRLRTLRRAVTLCAALCVSVAGRRR